MSIIKSVSVEQKEDNGTSEAKKYFENINNEVQHSRVLIINTMVVLAGMKKPRGMATMCHLKQEFLRKTSNMS